MANFLSLPRELRDQIYSDVFLITANGRDHATRLNILLTCRKIYHELAVRVYSSSTFHLSRMCQPRGYGNNPNFDLSYLARSLDSMDVVLRRSITEITVSSLASAFAALQTLHTKKILPSKYRFERQDRRTDGCADVLDFGVMFGIPALTAAIQEIVVHNPRARDLQLVVKTRPLSLGSRTVWRSALGKMYGFLVRSLESNSGRKIGGKPVKLYNLRNFETYHPARAWSILKRVVGDESWETKIEQFILEDGKELVPTAFG